MGNNSTKTDTNFDTSVINSSIQSAVNKASVSTSSGQYQGQNIIVDVGGNVDLSGHCSVSLSNDAKMSLLTLSNLSSNLDTNFSAQQKTDIQNSIQKQIEQKNEQLNLFQNNTVEDSTNVSNNVNNSVKQEIDNYVSNIVQSTSVSGQSVTLTINGNLKCSDYSTLNLNNTSDQQSVTNSITNNVVKDISSNEQTTEILDKYKLTVKQTNVGTNVAIVLIILLLIVFSPMIFGGSALKASLTIILPVVYLILVGGTIFSAYQQYFLYAFIMLAILWIITLVKLLTPVPNPQTATTEMNALQSGYPGSYPAPMLAGQPPLSPAAQNIAA